MADYNLTGRLQQSIVAYAALGMLVIGAIIAVGSIVPLYQHLKEERVLKLLLAVRSKTQAVEEYLASSKEIAFQISSRTKPREYLELYNQGQINRQELVTASQKGLRDALNISQEIVGITRLDATGKQAIQLGLSIPAGFSPIPATSPPAAKVYSPVIIADESYLIVGVPIINPQSKIVGTDIVLFRLSRLRRIVEKDRGLEATGETILGVRKNEQVVLGFPLRKNPGTVVQGFPKHSTIGEAIARSQQQDTGIIPADPASGNPDIIAYGAISGTNWAILVKIRATELYGPSQRQIAPLGSLMLVLLLLGTSGLVRVLRSLTSKTMVHTDELERLLQEKTASLQTELSERKRAEAKIAAHARTWAVVSGLGQWALAGMELATLMEEATLLVTKTLNVEYCDLWELLAGGKTLLLRAGAGWPSGSVGVTKVGTQTRSMAGYTLLVNQPVIVADLRGETRFSGCTLLVNNGVISGISAIVYGPGSIPFGVLGAHSTKHRQFSEDDVYFLQAIANVLATALEHKSSQEALRDREEQYALAVAGANDGLWDWNLITNTIYFSLRWKSMLGHSENEIGDTPEEWFGRVHSEDRELFKAAIAEHLAGISPHFKSEHRMLEAQGTYRWMLSRGLAVRDEAGIAYRMAGSMTDISDRKAAEEENIRLAAFPRNSPNPFLACSPDGEVIYVNPATEQVLDRLKMGLSTGFLPANHRQIVRSCLENQHQDYQLERRIQDRVFSWIYHPIPSLQVVHLHTLDITERHRAEDQLRHDARHDALTGLPNRALFLDQLGLAVKRAKTQEDYLFAVVFLDLDRFKVVNDSLGHLIGDQLLITFARRLQKCLGYNDILARFGGDEFTVLLDEINDISDAIRVADRIQKELTLPFNIEGHEVFTTASIGIALSATGYDQPEDLLRDADIAMYRAKARGKARHEVFDTTMHERAVVLLKLENDLRRAIQSDKWQLPSEQKNPLVTGYSSISKEFLLHYQPIVALDTGMLEGFEALVRWQHPSRGIVSPAEFIPVAEETGLIIPLGAWVLREACLQLRRWQQSFPMQESLSISVNLSGQQLTQPDLISQIDQILEETHLDTNFLKLEITESVLMENAESAAELLEQLRGRNIQLCIDDFGTGYSSLSYLHRFPINTLKIDRSFVNQMGADDENAEIVRAIAMLAHNLGMYVVAEGVETEEQLVQLWALQCEYGQGYFFSKPLPPEAATALIEKGQRW